MMTNTEDEIRRVITAGNLEGLRECLHTYAEQIQDGEAEALERAIHFLHSELVNARALRAHLHTQRAELEVVSKYLACAFSRDTQLELVG